MKGVVHITFKKFEEWYLERRKVNDWNFNLALLSTLFYNDVIHGFSGKDYKESKKYWKECESKAKELVKKMESNSYILKGERNENLDGRRTY